MKLGTLLNLNAKRFPDRVAVVCGDDRITFAALEDRANRFANALGAAGVLPGDRVVVFLANSVALIEAMAGILKSGALVVPLSTRLSAQEIAYIVGHCEPAAMIYSPDLRSQAATALEDQPGMRRLVVGEPAADETAFASFVDAGAPDLPTGLPAAPDDCMIAYTSGTTGRPKGAVGTHANFVTAQFMQALEWGLSADDTIFASTAMAHRTGLGRMANMFYVGCRLVMQPRFDAAEALDLIEREAVTVIGGVPTVFRLLMPEFERRPEAAATVRLIAATGEVFPTPLKERLRAALPDTGLFTFLAQTEAGLVAGLRPEEQTSKPGSIGRPSPGVELRAVGPDGEDAALGEPGELYLRCGEPGRGISMREYYKNPEATAAAFDGDWFKTGDIGYFDEDGFVYFADRAKDMIVTGGLNVYSKEVEATLVEHEAVADAAVIGVPDAEFGEAVAAYVIVKDGRIADADDIIAHCRARIASYKKPKFVQFVDDLPRNATGKVLKQELKRAFARAPSEA